MIVLDINVVSESLRAHPHPQVTRWLSRHRASGFFITAVSMGELLFGVDLLPTGRRKQELRSQVENLLSTGFRNRILEFDVAAARSYASVAAGRQQAGRRLPVPDAQIAGICLNCNAPLATRNTKDFEDTGIELINPWELS